MGKRHIINQNQKLLLIHNNTILGTMASPDTQIHQIIYITSFGFSIQNPRGIKVDMHSVQNLMAVDRHF